MNHAPFPKISSLDQDRFLFHKDKVAPGIPFESTGSSILASSGTIRGRRVGNRWAIQPMEGWDGTREGRPTDRIVRRWQRFGLSGAKLIWGGEAAAVRHDGRANPYQLRIGEDTIESLQDLLQSLKKAHGESCGSVEDLVVGLQLTHSGRFSVPDEWHIRRPKGAIPHPILDARVGLNPDKDLFSDEDLWELIEQFVNACRLASQTGFDFVDIKHCHGYLGHELLASRERKGEFGGDLAHRTRFLREIVSRVRTELPDLLIGVRVSAFDMIPFEKGPSQKGQPCAWASGKPYLCGFGVNPKDPSLIDLSESLEFVKILQDLGVDLLNVSGGSPYYTPHLIRPALFPPSDGYLPPEDPLQGVERHIVATRALKEAAGSMWVVGSGYTYLQEYLPQVAEGVVKRGWADSAGIGRMVLSYPELPAHSLAGQTLDRKRICRTFSDCTSAPRNKLPSGCYPLDPEYKDSPEAMSLKEIRSRTAPGGPEHR